MTCVSGKVIDIYENFNNIEIPTDPTPSKNGKDGVGILSITQGTGAQSNVIFITLTNNQQFTFTIPTIKGDSGDSISIQSTTTSEIGTNVVTVITFSDGESVTFTIPKGSNGEDGEDGKDGEDGLNILSGTVNPSSATGRNGEHYINTNSGEVFKKTSGSWTNTGLSLKGEDGENGTGILSGFGEPSNAVGEDDNVFLDLTDGEVYKKLEGEWTSTGLNIKGGDGENGENGNKIYSDDGVPDGTSNSGDLYLNKLNGDVYQYDTNWNLLLNIKGRSVKVFEQSTDPTSTNEVKAGDFWIVTE